MLVSSSLVFEFEFPLLSGGVITSVLLSGGDVSLSVEVLFPLLSVEVLFPLLSVEVLFPLLSVEVLFPLLSVLPEFPGLFVLLFPFSGLVSISVLFSLPEFELLPEFSLLSGGITSLSVELLFPLFSSGFAFYSGLLVLELLLLLLLLLFSGGVDVFPLFILSSNHPSSGSTPSWSKSSSIGSY